MHYSADLTHQFRKAAGYVARILGGTEPAELPVRRSIKFELAINMKTARSLGLTIAPTIMVRAERIIE
jgi:putative ABC transport system substrate-binding protein